MCYYDNDGEYKRKPNPSNSEEPLEPSIDVISAVVQSNGSMIVKGRVNNAPSEFDYQTLRPDFLGDGALTGPSTVQAQGNGLFTMFVVATPTDAYGPKADAGKPVELRITTAGDFQTQAGENVESKPCNPVFVWPPPIGTSVANICHKFVLQRIFGSQVESGTDALELMAKKISEKNMVLFPGNVELFLRNEKFYLKNLIYDPNFGSSSSQAGAKSRTFIPKKDTARPGFGGTITVGNWPFKTAAKLAKSMMHEYVLRRAFVNGQCFKQRIGELEIEAYQTTSSINENKATNDAMTLRINNKDIRLTSAELKDDKDSKKSIEDPFKYCLNLEKTNKLENAPRKEQELCAYSLAQPQKYPAYDFDKKQYE